MIASSIQPFGSRCLPQASPACERDGDIAKNADFETVFGAISVEMQSEQADGCAEDPREAEPSETSRDAVDESMPLVLWVPSPERQRVAISDEREVACATIQSLPPVLVAALRKDMTSAGRNETQTPLIGALGSSEPETAGLKLLQETIGPSSRMVDEEALHKTQVSSQFQVFPDQRAEHLHPADIDLQASASPAGDLLPMPVPAVQILTQVGSALFQSTTSTPTPAPIQNLWHSDMALMSSTELKSFRIKLHPEELGEVQITFRRVGPETKVMIEVAGKAAAEALSRDLYLLEDRLGALFGSGTLQPVTVILQSQEPEVMPGSPTQFTREQNVSDAALSGGHGSGRDSRAGPDNEHTSMRKSEGERNEEDALVRAHVGIGRVV